MIQSCPLSCCSLCHNYWMDDVRHIRTFFSLRYNKNIYEWKIAFISGCEEKLTWVESWVEVEEKKVDMKFSSFQSRLIFPPTPRCRLVSRDDTKSSIFRHDVTFDVVSPSECEWKLSSRSILFIRTILSTCFNVIDIVCSSIVWALSAHGADSLALNDLYLRQAFGYSSFVFSFHSISIITFMHSSRDDGLRASSTTTFSVL